MAFNFNPKYCTKEDLYKALDIVRYKRDINRMKGNPNFYKDCASSSDINVLVHDLLDRELRGFALPHKQTIVLNSLRTDTEKNFDCAHEFVHLFLHKNEDYNAFDCRDREQVPYIEWQANEGAAEILIPYRTFIPEFLAGFHNCTNKQEYWKLINYFSSKHNVTHSVVRNRIDSLKYEINQYENGIKIANLQILSSRQQQANNIYIPSYHNRFRTNKKAPTLRQQCKG